MNVYARTHPSLSIEEPRGNASPFLRSHSEAADILGGEALVVILVRHLGSIAVLGAIVHASCSTEPSQDPGGRTVATSIGSSGVGGGSSATTASSTSSSATSTSAASGGATSSGAGGAASTVASAGGAGGVGPTGSGATGGSGGSGAGGSGGISGTGGSGATGGNVGAPQFKAGELGAPSNGGTITFQNIGKAGWFPSRRDPATGPCDFANAAGCCKTHFDIASDKLTPWDEDLIMTLRGPLVVKQLVAYQPVAGDATRWQLTSAWDDRSATSPKGAGFNGNRTETAGFNGVVGTECLVDVSTDRVFPCGP